MLTRRIIFWGVFLFFHITLADILKWKRFGDGGLIEYTSDGKKVLWVQPRNVNWTLLFASWGAREGVEEIQAKGQKIFHSLSWINQKFLISLFLFTPFLVLSRRGRPKKGAWFTELILLKYIPLLLFLPLFFLVAGELEGNITAVELSLIMWGAAALWFTKKNTSEESPSK